MNPCLDPAYIVKCYLNDPDAPKVRELVQQAEALHSSAWCVAEVPCAIHRRVREGSLTPREGSELRRLFLDHVSKGLWTLFPVTDVVLRGVDASLDGLPSAVFLRAGDAIHLVSARTVGFEEIWTNDRHVLQAARYFGLAGRSV